MPNKPWKNARICLQELVAELPSSTTISVNRGTDEDIARYYKNARLFNRRLDRNPFIIVYCESASDVKITYNIAVSNNLPIRVRGGGHDHEGESSGTDTVLIDLSKMDSVDIDHETGIAKIGPGNRFIKLTTDLANKDVMIAHGTCATVCISGFTLGGGWGPWTRKYGMNCERLVGATIMLGDGELVDVDEVDGHVPDLLWALKGGGGMSYGIVTEFRIQTFPLPDHLIKFELEWNRYKSESPVELNLVQHVPTIKVLKVWEEIIKSKNTGQLIGTNLKINGKPAEGEFDAETITHNCVMYGYWEGAKTDLDKFVKDHFGDIAPVIKIDGTGGENPKENYGKRLMSSWDRESFHEVQKGLIRNGLLEGKPIPPDLDKPAPHKITNRLVNKEGLGDVGHSQLLRSLTSPLILENNRKLGLFTYVTLGAIVGDYYYANPDGYSAFPYKDKLYTIQYQTWWNIEDNKKNKNIEKAKGQNSNVYDNTNRALDWMEVSRDFDIPNTSGAFISFKDSSIPTATYFGKSYEKLKQIKIELCKDPHNHFRTRKTII